MAAGQAFDLRVGIVWSQTGLNELIQQAQSQLSRLKSAAATGSVVGPSGGQATRGEIKAAIDEMRAQVAAQAKTLGLSGSQAINQMFDQWSASIMSRAKSAGAAGGTAGAAAGIGSTSRATANRPGGTPLILSAQEEQAAAIRRDATAQAEETAQKIQRSEQLARQRVEVREATYRALNADNRYAEAQAAAAREKAQTTARGEAAIAADAGYIEATAAAARSRQLAAARVTLAGAGEDYKKLGTVETLARATMLRRVAGDEARIAAARAVTDTDIRSMALRRAEEAKLNAAIRLRERAYIREAVKTGELQAMGLGGTRFQRAQARFGTWAGKAPSDYPTIGQFAGQKSLQTLGYGVTGMATGALFFGIADLAKDASQLESTFVKLRGQLDAIGQGTQFSQVRDQIKGIAAETGLAATDVTAFSQRLIGVYGGDVEKAMAETSAAMKLAVVAGLDMKTMMESVVPTAKAFGMSMADIGDLAVSVSDQFGITADDFLQFAGRAAIVSAQAGLSIRELTVVAGYMSHELGVSMESSAESFNKMPELVQRNQEKIYQVLRQGGDASAAYVARIQEQLAAGKPGQAAILLLEASTKLGEGPQAENMRTRLAQLISVKREIEQGTALMKSAPQITTALAEGKLGPADAAGKLDRRFQDLQDTVSQTFKRIGREFENIAETLYSSGLSDAISSIGALIQGVAAAVNGVTTAFKNLNDQTKGFGPLQVPDGVLNSILKLGAITFVAAKAFKFMAGLRKADTGAAGTEAADATARSRNAGAATEAAAAIRSENVARESGIAGAVRSAEVETADAVARQRAAAAATAQAGATGQAAAATGAAAATSGLTQQQLLARSLRPVTRGGAGVGWVQPGVQGFASKQAATEAGVGYRRLKSGRYLDLSTGREISGAQAGAAMGRARGYTDSIPAPLPPPPLSAGKFGLWQKATYGGSLLGSGTADERALAAGRTPSKGLKPNAGQGALVAAMVVAGVAVVKDAYDSEQAKIEAQANDLRTKMSKATREQLAAVENTRTDWLERFSLTVFGQDLPEDMASWAGTLQDYRASETKWTAGALAGNKTVADKFAKQISDDNLAVLEGFFEKSDAREDLARQLGLAVEDPSLVNRALSLAGFGISGTVADTISYEGGNVTLTRENLDTAIAKATEAAKGEGERAAEAAKFLQEVAPMLERQVGMNELNEEVKRLVAADKKTEAIATAAGGAEYIEAEFGTLKKQYAAGQISTGTYLRDLAENEARVRDALAQPGVDTEKRDEALAALADIRKEIDKALDDAALGTVETVGILAELQGSNDAAGARLDARIAALPKLSRETRLAQVPDLLKDVQESFQNELAAIADPVARARRELAGFEIPPEVQDLFAEKQIKDNPELEAMLEDVAPSLDMNLAQISSWVVKQMRENKQNLQTAVITAIRAERKKLVDELAGVPGEFGSFAPAAVWLKDQDTIQVLKSMGEGKAGIALEGLAGFFAKSSDEMAIAVIELAEAEGISFDEAYKKLVQRARERVEREAAADGVISLEEQRQIELLKKLEDEAGISFGGTTLGPGGTGKTGGEAKLRRGVLEAEAAAKKVDAEGRAAAQPRNKLAAAQAEIDSAMVDVAMEQAAIAEGAEGDETKLKEAQNRLARARTGMEDVRRAIEDAWLGWGEILAAGDPVAENMAQMQQAQVNLFRAQADADIEGTIRAQQEIFKLQQQAEDNQRALLASRLSVQAAIMERDPVQAAELALRQAELVVAGAKGEAAQNEAEAGRIQAQHALEDALSARIESRSTLAIAMADAAGDSVRSARIALDEAQRKLDEAVAKGAGEGEINQLIAGVVSASAALASSMSELFSAQSSLAIAIAEAAGDSVGAARLAAQEAQRKLDEAIARGAGETEITQLRAPLVTANANLFRTQLSEEQEAIDFMREMGQITLSQALDAYRNLLGRTKEGTDEYRNLMRAIKSMENEAKADYQFNLPSTLGLPTLYEARRANQGMWSGVGYQDNRNVSVVIAVNGVQDPVAVSNQVLSAFQSALGSGVTNTPRVGVGA